MLRAHASKLGATGLPSSQNDPLEEANTELLPNDGLNSASTLAQNSGITLAAAWLPPHSRSS